jgi:hypothetical protein
MNRLPLKYRRLLVTTLVCIGAVLIFRCLVLQASSTRSNAEDDWAWRLWDIGWFLVGMGGSLPFVRPVPAVLIGIATPFVMFALAVIAVWGFIFVNAALR